MTSRFPPFAFVELVSLYNKKNITRWLEDMNFKFSWQGQYPTRSLRSLLRYCSCHSNIKFISSRHRVISSIYVWIYENGVKEFASYHPYFTLISLLLKAASKPCKRAKNRERTAMKGRQMGGGRENGLTFLLIFMSSPLEKKKRKTPG